MSTFCLFQEEIGFSMKILDIGGGFNGCETQLELVSTVISVDLREMECWSNISQTVI